jgi:TRAP-type uncharacterized transport system fused permease subunit
LPGILAVQSAYTWQRFFGHVYSDAGILGPTTAVSSTYIILFIIFAAFLQASKVGDYFVNFAFAAAGRARGGPAKVAIFASGLMGMINGTSAGNVVATGSLTIPLMKKVGYTRRPPARSRPPPRPAGRSCRRSWAPAPSSWPRSPAFPTPRSPSPRSSRRSSISCRSTSWSISRRRSSACAACATTNCRSSRRWRQVYLFLPIIILIVALFMGYSVIRAGTLATVAAAVVSGSPPPDGAARSIIKAFELAGSCRSRSSRSAPVRASSSA